MPGRDTTGNTSQPASQESRLSHCAPIGARRRCSGSCRLVRPGHINRRTIASRDVRGDLRLTNRAWCAPVQALQPYTYRDQKGDSCVRARPCLCRCARDGRDTYADTTRSPEECAALRSLQLPGIALSEVSAEWIPAGPAPSPFAPPPATIALPAYCRVQGTLHRRKGADG